MKIGANEIRVDHILEVDKQLYVVRKIDHVKPGKGGAFVQTELKHLLTENKFNIKFRSDEFVEKMDIYEKEGNFLYKDKNSYVFLDTESFEEYMVNDLKNPEFYTEGCKIILVISSADELLTVKLPDKIECEVDLTDGYISGQSVSSQEKNATLTNGVVVRVPQYIKNGDKILINSKDFSFNSRVSK